jgi:hypothetical protein
MNMGSYSRDSIKVDIKSENKEEVRHTAQEVAKIIKDSLFPIHCGAFLADLLSQCGVNWNEIYKEDSK